MTFINPKKIDDNDLLNIIDDGPLPYHVMSGHPAYRRWLDECWKEAVRRGLR